MKCYARAHERHVCFGPVEPGPFGVPLCKVARVEIDIAGLARWERLMDLDLRLIGAGLAEARERGEAAAA